MKDLKTILEEGENFYNGMLSLMSQVLRGNDIEHQEKELSLWREKFKQFLISKIHQAEARGKIEGFREVLEKMPDKKDLYQEMAKGVMCAVKGAPGFNEALIEFKTLLISHLNNKIK